MMGPNNSFMAKMEDSFGDIPRSICWVTPSTITMASSTTIPIANTKANKVNKLILYPSNNIAKKVPIIVTGTVVAGTKVARKFCKNTIITINTKIPASNSVLYTSFTEALTKIVVSNGTEYSNPGGNFFDIFSTV